MSARRIERNVARIRRRLGCWPVHMAARYNGPVYLVGSTLHNPAPRDCDLRIIVEDLEFAARYGARLRMGAPRPKSALAQAGIVKARMVPWLHDGPTQRWVDDVAKFTAALSKLLKTNVDLQVWPRSVWFPDAWPPPLELAAPSPAWWFDNRYTRRRK